MSLKKLVRITTVPISLEKLLEGQLTYMSKYFEVVAMSSDPERLAEYGKKNGVRVQAIGLTRRITPIKDIQAIYSLYRFLRKERPVIVHTHTPKAGMVGMIAARLAGVPNRLHTVAGLPVMEAKGLKRLLLGWVERLTYAMATRVYPNSFKLKKYIQDQGWASASDLKVLLNGSSNGIDTTYFDPSCISEQFRLQLRSELGILKDDHVFVFVGRLVGDKGINELVAAFEQLNITQPTTNLILVGPLEEDLDPLSPFTLERIQVNPRIHAVRYQQDVRPYLSISDALVFPSYREGFPNVVLQSAAMGLACIVSDINGCNEIITDQQNGILVPAKNAELLQQAMDAIITDQILMEGLKAAARPSVKDRFERVVFWEALLGEYQSILESNEQHT